MHTMTHDVPHWDNSSYSVTASEYTNLCHIEKGGAHQHQYQALQPSQYLQQHQSFQQRKLDSAFVPNYDVLEALTHTGMQGDGGTHTIGGPECSSIPALDVPVRMNNPTVHEDEMLSWLRYPLEDSFDRNYCSEMFGELMNPHVQLVKDGFVHQTMKDESTSALNIDGNMGCEQVGLQLLTKTGSTIWPSRPGIKSDAAMALGAGRAAGLLSQTGSEAFNCVRTHVNPSALLKSLSVASMELSSDGKRAGLMVDPVATALPPLSSGFNFSLFSRPVATTMDSLRLVGGASGPTNVERVRQPLAKDLQLPCEPNASGDSVQSNAVNKPSSQQSTEFTSQGNREKGGAISQGLCSPTGLPCGSVVRSHGEAAELNSHVTCVPFSEDVVGTSEAAEATLSPSCLSRSSSEKIAQEAFTPSPKKSSSSAQYSEDVEDVAANAKKPPPGPRSTKRSRAAETHNESEKKRRNKINVRLKLLQSLIPNSNKTDKASVLDEAIEYTKMLQAQVQFMSMKTGMFFPAMMPSGMHYVSMQQMPAFPHLGMGMGMGIGVDMGVGMHVADMNAVTPVGVGAGVIAGTGAGAGATINMSSTIHQPLPGIAHSGTEQLQTGLPSTNHDVSGCLRRTACTSEPYKVMSQQPLQPVLMNVQRSADVYSASLQQRPPRPPPLPPPQENHMTNVFC